MQKENIIFGMATRKRDFTTIRILIQQCMLVRSVEFDSYLSRIVHDAKAIVNSSSNISTIDNEVYYYSVYLGEKGRSWIDKLNPDDLKEDDYKKILEVFETP